MIMKKNDKTLSVSDIEETKKVLTDDLDKVQGRLDELEKMKVQVYLNFHQENLGGQLIHKNYTLVMVH